MLMLQPNCVSVSHTLTEIVSLLKEEDNILLNMIERTAGSKVTYTRSLNPLPVSFTIK